MSQLTGKFLKGFFALLPLILSVAILVWIFHTAESVAKDILLLVLPRQAYTPGLGILVSLVLITFFGHLVDQKVTRRLFKVLEGPFQILPVVRSIYTAVKDFTQYLAPHERRSSSRVVLVNFKELGVELMGLVTRPSLDGLPEPLSQPGKVAVYIPMSYQFGGYTVFVSREQIREVPMPTEQAMRSILTAWVTGSKLEGL